ncbi:NADH:ubiquinone oxidoreductase [Blyttiomyces sp. JEL0837]|nr:NADH:ubiquinone oxidoreductase [Blyttiomyces sp. JEL0837]
MVKEVKNKELIIQNSKKELGSIPYGLLVWATGNTARPLVSNLMKKLPADLQNQRRGLVTDDWLLVKGSGGSIYCLGDASATKYAPTAQVASRQVAYLAQQFSMLHQLEPQIESLKAQGQDPTPILKQIPPFSLRNKTLVSFDWLKCWLFGRDVTIEDSGAPYRQRKSADKP